MFLYQKKNLKGFLLLEAVISIGILAVGVVAVMQSFAAQHKGVTLLKGYTQRTLFLYSSLGGLLNGITPQGLIEQNAWDIQLHSDALGDGETKLKKISLIAQEKGNTGRTMTVWTYGNADETKKN
ncbi:MAG: hypothetical protein HQL16_08350 [Candidatus Omnitrophica bacterium]|nr:hypothetical protein [Candidatus Omnitrophota bacterium]